MSKLKRRQKGFTLIEVLLIVVILGIIAAIAIPRLMASKAEAQEKTCRTNVANLNTAIEKYYFDFGDYPDSIKDDLCTEVTLPDGTKTTYMPDGEPKCPAKGNYSIDANNHRAKCDKHGDIYGVT